MGYTHYWTLENGIETSSWDKFLTGAKEIIETAKEAGIPLDDSSTGENIFFNGVGDNAHETFSITSEDVGFDFCKTAEKPYDTVVTAVLIWLKTVLGDAVQVKSDGVWQDWEGGALLFETVFDIQPNSVFA